jgi:hypothetical protein
MDECWRKDCLSRDVNATRITIMMGQIKAFKQLLIVEPNYDHGGGKIQGLIHELQEAKIEHEKRNFLRGS